MMDAPADPPEPEQPVFDLDEAFPWVGGGAATGFVALLIAGYRSLFTDSTKDRDYLRCELGKLRGEMAGDRAKYRAEMDDVRRALRACEERERGWERRDHLLRMEVAELRHDMKAGHQSGE
jgi:hypothetical protein